MNLEMEMMHLQGVIPQLSVGMMMISIRDARRTDHIHATLLSMEMVHATQPADYTLNAV